MSGGKPVVWITRPQPGADRTAAALSARGFEPVVLPLTEIALTDPQIGIDDAARAHFVTITSGNAARLAPATLVEALNHKPVYAVGDATKAEALARGFSDVKSAGGDVDDLVELVARYEKPGAAFVYLCGRRRTGDLDGKLARKGYERRLAEVYSTKIVSHMTDLLDDALTRRRPDAILFHSSLSARAFASHAAAAPHQAYEKTLFFSMSARVAGPLPDEVKTRLTVSSEPTEPSMLNALSEKLPGAGN